MTDEEVRRLQADNERLLAENADIQEGDILLAVGYGYNVMKNPKDAVASNPILKIHQLRRTPGGIDATFQAHTYTGTSFQQLIENYKASASVSASYLGFKAEASTAFGRSATSETSKAFAYSVVNAEVTDIMLEGVNKVNRKKLMTEDASMAINGTPDEYGNGLQTTIVSASQGFKYNINLNPYQMRYGCTGSGYVFLKKTGEMGTNAPGYKDWYMCVRLMAK